MRVILNGIFVAALLAVAAIEAGAQALSARQALEQAADAMGGLDRILAVDTLTMTGFGQYLTQNGGGNPSPDARAPTKWQAANGVVRDFDLRTGTARNTDRRGNLFPFANRRGHSWDETTQIQTGIDALDHPLTALRAALADDSSLGAVSVDGEDIVVEFTITSGETLWLALDGGTMLPAWLRWIGPSTTLGDLTHTAYFTGYLPFDDVLLPVGLTATIDWRATTTANFHVDSYAVDSRGFRPISRPDRRAPSAAAEAVATPVADGIWDVRYGGNAGAVVEFADHLTMFEAYGSEPATFARIDLANTLVPGKAVTEVIVSHHHFDHSGGLRAAVARGLTIISRRGNEQIFREMVARPAPNFPDALARNPLPLKFVPVDDRLTLEDATMRLDIYHVVGHMHMAEAIFAYAPVQRVLLEGDFTTYNWDFNWWGGAYVDNVERYDLDPAINIPVHGMVTTFDATIAAIEEQVARAQAFCAQNERSGIYMAGCPVRYSRD